MAFVLVFGESRADDGDYFPLVIGNEWHFDVPDPENPYSTRIGTISKSIVESVERDGKTYFLMRIVNSGPKNTSTSTLLFRKDATGVFSLTDGVNSAANHEHERQLMTFPLEPGKRVLGELKSQRVSFEDLVVGNITYPHCLRLNSSDFHIRSDRWFARGVGEVKTSTSGPFGTSSITLQEFKAGH